MESNRIGTLKILSWNANSLKAHGEELKHFISTETHMPDIICVQETFLKNTDEFNLDGYSIIRKDRSEKKGGGVATMVRNGISYTALTTTENTVENIIIEIKSLTKKIKIGNIYCPPNQHHKEADLQPLFKERNIILVGDFNAHSSSLGSRTINTRGRILETLIEKYNFSVVSTGAGTRINFNGSDSPIDIALASNNLSTCCNWEVYRNSLGSDHFPTVVDFNEPPSYEESDSSRWSFKKADWGNFKRKCQELLSGENFQILPGDEINVVYERFIETLTEAASTSIPKTKPRVGRKNVPYWNNKCQEAVEKRNEALNKMRRTQELSDCIAYRVQKGITQKVIKDAKRTCWRDYCGSVNEKTKMSDIWRTTRKMSGVKQQHTIPNLKKNETIYETNAQKAQLFAETFAMASSDNNYSDEFKTNRRNFKPDNIQKNIQEENQQEINKAFELHELRSAINKCKRKSAPGLDSISYEIIKEIPRSGLIKFLEIINLIWSRGDLPGNWKHAIINPILKPTKPNDDPSSYRPISLTSTCCKIMERMISERLVWYLETNKLLNKNQSGFRRNRSCTDQIMRLQDDINKAIHTKGHTIGIFIDLEKAYDMIWKDGLLYKLRQLGIENEMYNWIDDFLTDRTIQVRIGNELSDVIKLENGTPQGSVLSSVLFLVMINDLPVPDPDNEVKLSIFADDCSIWRSGKNLKYDASILQKYFERYQNWCNIWGFRISKSKTTAVVFSKKIEPEKQIELKIDGENISFEKSVKFLGVIFDCKLTWNEHIRYVSDRCSKRINLLRALTGTDWGANKKTLIMLYRTLIRSIIDYGSIAYDSASESSKRLLDQIQSKSLRICCGAMIMTPVAALQVECGEVPLGLRRRELQLQYAAKLRANPDNPTRTILIDCWQNKIKYPKEKEPFFVKIKNFQQIIETTGEIIMENEYPTQPPWITQHIPGTNGDEEATNEVSHTRNHASICRMNDHALTEEVNQCRNEDETENTNSVSTTNTCTGTDPVDVPQQNNEAITIKEAKMKILKYIDSTWQKQWDESTKGTDYRKIEPFVSRKLRLTHMNRRNETIATRLRLGKCNLNFYLNIIGKHATGNCPTCNVPETIEHFILQCSNNTELLTELKQQCTKE